jgi:hypothetical protein
VINAGWYNASKTKSLAEAKPYHASAKPMTSRTHPNIFLSFAVIQFAEIAQER